jgi:uncharacterized membrane protein
MTMNETISYVEAVVVIGCLLYVGAVVLDKLSSADLINATGSFNTTVTNVASMWASSTSMIATVVIIGAAAIIIGMVMNFRRNSKN